MTTTTFFYNDNGGINSIRTTSGSGKRKYSMNTYIGSTRGGVTFNHSSGTNRINNKGQHISSGFRGPKITYRKSNGSFNNQIKSF